MIELAQVHKAFGPNAVLRGVDLSIAKSTSMVIIGGSGTGKSVMLKSVLGLVTPDSGTITVDGQPNTSGDRDAFLARFGMLFQGALRRVGLTPDVADRFPAELSGGMQKRVGLARAIAAEPEIIFFDEPTTGLDPIMAGVINDLIREIVTEMGATAMTITHDMSSVRAIADNVAMLHACADPYVDQFIHGRASGPIEAVR